TWRLGAAQRRSSCVVCTLASSESAAERGAHVDRGLRRLPRPATGCCHSAPLRAAPAVVIRDEHSKPLIPFQIKVNGNRNRNLDMEVLPDLANPSVNLRLSVRLQDHCEGLVVLV